MFSIDPVVSGPTTGTLSLAFDAPTSLLRFDVLLLSIFDIDNSDSGPSGGPAYTVQLSTGLSLTGGTSPQPQLASFFAMRLGLVAIGLMRRRR